MLGEQTIAVRTDLRLQMDFQRDILSYVEQHPCLDRHVSDVDVQIVIQARNPVGSGGRIVDRIYRDAFDVLDQRNVTFGQERTLSVETVVDRHFQGEGVNLALPDGICG